MNRSLLDRDCDLLIVPNFTLAADTSKGMRASFTSVADPQAAAELFRLLAAETADLPGKPVACGRFGASMQVALVNNGPVTFTLTCKCLKKK